jgi:hypothetical protein
MPAVTSSAVAFAAKLLRDVLREHLAEIRRERERAAACDEAPPIP